MGLAELDLLLKNKVRVQHQLIHHRLLLRLQQRLYVTYTVPRCFF